MRRRPVAGLRRRARKIAVPPAPTFNTGQRYFTFCGSHMTISGKIASSTM